MSTNEQKLEFLKSVEQPDIEGILSDYIASGARVGYPTLTSQNAHGTGAITAKDLEAFSGIVYKAWYDEMCEIAHKKGGDDALLQAAILVNTDSKYRPENIAEGPGFYRVISHFNLVQSQDGESFMPEQGRVFDDFLHVKTKKLRPLEKTVDIECRLYLNIEGKSILAVAGKLLEASLENKTPLYMKFTPSDRRNDTLLVYTDYATAPWFINTLKNMRKISPELFHNAENLNPLLGKVDGFIGFGEEPVYRHTSFNDARARAIGAILDHALQAFSKETIVKNSAKQIINTSSGESLSQDDYLKYLIKRKVKETQEYKSGKINLDSESNEARLNSIIEEMKYNLAKWHNIEPSISFFDGMGKAVNIDMKHYSFEDKLCSVYGVSPHLNERQRKWVLNRIFFDSPSEKSELINNAFKDDLVEGLTRKSQYKQSKEYRMLYPTQKPEEIDLINDSIKEIEQGSDLGEQIVLKAKYTFQKNVLGGYTPSILDFEREVGKTKVYESLNSNIIRRLVEIFPVEAERILSVRENEQSIKTAFAEHDISLTHPCLNASTVKQLGLDSPTTSAKVLRRELGSAAK